MLAVALFTFAAIRSITMQAAELAPGASSCGMPRIGAMAGMAMPQAPGKAAKTGKPPCDFCATAAHAPLATPFVRPAPPISVALAPPYRAIAAHGPRGPPPVRPRSRGPPTVLLAA